MGTIYVRDVDERVVETLKRRAAEQGLSLSALAARELSRAAARPENHEITARLGRIDRQGAPSTDEIVAALHASRP